MQRKRTRTVNIGGVGIGGDNPVRVQSMCNTDTRDVLATVAQIHQLAEAGCEIVRLAVPDEAAAAKLAAIREQSPVPLIADIHFDHRLALAALDAGFDGLRINPGNIGDEAKVDAVVRAAKERSTPIRIGVNGGSLEKDLLKQYGGPTPEAMVESGLRHVRMLEARGFHDIKISLKTSSVLKTMAAYRLMSEQVDYPLHIGITEAGTLVRGAVKSSVGLGILLHEGIGDTMRVSLTHDPVAEIGVAYEILRSLGLRERGPEIISCPTCGRTEIGLIELAERVEAALRGVEEVFTVAVMGCVVNGPGEAREADIGIAGGRDLGIIFRKGEVVRKVRGNANLLPEFMKEIDKFLEERRTD
ncbi:flavodoxin-dependent (E)-4-hydroxy-3-methylbut-2-enyl-diphosphate synthase [Pseudodesulfovibrio hydrargyri]|uniref:flavodoxin-dependent (E)-4-hydroxy-3-methylbut-2-enyl-diphosphate synthase n=1 Tax=Pseudodesulfovibrio hydrargyri TaxID=2125990 RepID=UPI0008FB7E3C|nr:flavodoxin-dependent (E)-4-hydroxy-3-methylbut-2-enyl-diphosphate synthase [Pseudodesulfovibrio hydrargyri]